LISGFSLVLIVVFFLFGDSPASEFYTPTFRNILFDLNRWCKQEETSAYKIQTPENHLKVIRIIQA